jgi:excisionase family DNA binding protein
MEADGPRLPTLLDLDGIADHLGVSPRHVRRLVAERRIPFLKWGHLLRFDPVEIAHWRDECRVRPPSMSHPAGTVLRDEPARTTRRRGSVSQRTSAASTAL